MHGVEKRAQLLWLGAHLHFNAAVVEIANPTGDAEAFRDLFNRVTKADALHSPFIENLHRSHDDLVGIKAASVWYCRARDEVKPPFFNAARIAFPESESVLADQGVTARAASLSVGRLD